MKKHNIFLFGSKIKLIFPYNIKIIEEVKKIPSRIWNPLTKAWQIAELTEVNLLKIVDIGKKFNLSISKEIFSLLAEKGEENKEEKKLLEEAVCTLEDHFYKMNKGFM